MREEQKKNFAFDYKQFYFLIRNLMNDSSYSNCEWIGFELSEVDWLVFSLQLWISRLIHRLVGLPALTMHSCQEWDSRRILWCSTLRLLLSTKQPLTWRVGPQEIWVEIGMLFGAVISVNSQAIWNACVISLSESAFNFFLNLCIVVYSNVVSWLRCLPRNCIFCQRESFEHVTKF